jgi:redox-sensitive bicupin YhaK (pirin superfamily)
MSGPVTTADVDAEPARVQPAPPEVEITDSREAQVGALHVRRALPRRARRTVGAWCFLDHAGPVTATSPTEVAIGPHPHIGLQTVTWLLAGEMLHHDSLGSEQVIRPGQLNLMTAGRGVVHAEEGTGSNWQTFHAVQLWVAQPSATRDAPPAFEHHAELPRGDFGAATATVLVGDLDGLVSPARRDTDHVGVDLDMHGPTTLPLRADFEHALVVTSGAVVVDGQVIEPGHLAYLGRGRDELQMSPGESARALLLGGVPFDEPVLMWWNYVARTKEEISAAHRDWTARTDRFGPVQSSLQPVDVAPPPWEVP